MTERRPIPDALRIAVRNAMGGNGPYVVREIEELFRTYGFSKKEPVTEDIPGVRREVAEHHQLAIDWSDTDEKRRYLMLVDDVLLEYPEKDGQSPKEARDIERALKLARLEDPPVPSGSDAIDLWHPPDAPRVFISHLTEKKAEAQNLSANFELFGFTSFVAHEAIKPGREWPLEIQRALRSCDVLVALVSIGFHDSEWTDQEVGWVLGRDLAVVPVSLDKTNPQGFLAVYQAVKRRRSESDLQLARRVFAAITDAVFNRQRANATTAADKIIPILARCLGGAKTRDGARTLSEMVRGIPARFLQVQRTRDALRLACGNNETLLRDAGVYERILKLIEAGGTTP